MYSPEEVFEACKTLKHKGLNDYGFSIAVAEAASSGHSIENMRLFISRFVKELGSQIIRPHYFTPVLVKCRNKKDILDVLSTDMRNHQFSPDLISDVFVEFIWPKCHNDFDSMAEKCLPLGYSLPFLFTTYIRYKVDHLDFQGAIGILRDERYSTYKIQNQPLTRFIGKAAASAGSVEEIVSLLKEVNKRISDFHVSEQNGSFLFFFLNFGGIKRRLDNGKEILLDHLLKKMNEEGMVISEKFHGTLMKSPSLDSRHVEWIDTMSVYNRPPSMHINPNENDDAMPQNIIDLENRLQDLIKQNSSSNSGSYDSEIRECITKLVIEYCKKGVTYVKVREQKKGDAPPGTKVDTDVIDMSNEDTPLPRYVKRVSELLKIVKSNRMPISDGVKSICYEFYATCGDFDACKQMRHEISPTFVINDFKVMNVAKFFIRSARIEEAIALIEEDLEKRRRIGYVLPDFQKESTKEIHAANFVRCVNEVAERTEDPVMVNKFFDLCSKFRNIKPIRGMLGPKIRVYLLRNDLPSAVREFTLLSNKYRETPFLGELMIHLLKANDIESLQKVVDVATDIHGKQAVSNELGFAFIMIGKKEEASKIFRKVAVSMVKLNNKVEALFKKGDLERLETMLAVLQTTPGVDQLQIKQYWTRLKDMASNRNSVGAMRQHCSSKNIL
jgi:hypothetical protein